MATYDISSFLVCTAMRSEGATVCLTKSRVAVVAKQPVKGSLESEECKGAEFGVVSWL